MAAPACPTTSKMESYFPALNLKAKPFVLMVRLLGLTLGTEVWVGLGTQAAIVATTRQGSRTWRA